MIYLRMYDALVSMLMFWW